MPKPESQTAPDTAILTEPNGSVTTVRIASLSISPKECVDRPSLNAQTVVAKQMEGGYRND